MLARLDARRRLVSHNDRARFRARMIERVLTQFQAIPKEDLDYLLEKLDYQLI